MRSRQLTQGEIISAYRAHLNGREMWRIAKSLGRCESTVRSAIKRYARTLEAA